MVSIHRSSTACIMMHYTLSNTMSLSSLFHTGDKKAAMHVRSPRIEHVYFQDIKDNFKIASQILVEYVYDTVLGRSVYQVS